MFECSSMTAVFNEPLEEISEIVWYEQKVGLDPSGLFTIFVDDETRPVRDEMRVLLNQIVRKVNRLEEKAVQRI